MSDEWMKTLEFVYEYAREHWPGSHPDDYDPTDAQLVELILAARSPSSTPPGRGDSLAPAALTGKCLHDVPGLRDAIIRIIPRWRHHSEAENADAILAAIEAHLSRSTSSTEGAKESALSAPRDPVEAVLAVECPNCLQQPGYFCSSIDDNLCAERIRKAIAR